MIGDKLLELFDTTASGPLSEEELHNVKIVTMPFLLDQDTHRSNLALLVARLILTVEEARKK